jgi:osmotically-inducible protein OsmY
MTTAKASSSIRTDVLNELNWTPGLDESEVRIAVDDEGVVTMTGHVPSWTERRKAEQAIKKVRGAHAVANDLEVRTAMSSKRDDTDIAEAALLALRWNYSVPEDKITVTVTNGGVTLEGDVDWQYQRDAARRAVQDLTGVKFVKNAVNVEPHVKAQKIKAGIASAFKRNAQIDAARVQVDTDHGRVKLTGTVHSWAEKREAASVAWAAPGVIGVENELRVRT